MVQQSKVKSSFVLLSVQITTAKGFIQTNSHKGSNIVWNGRGQCYTEAFHPGTGYLGTGSDKMIINGQLLMLLCVQPWSGQ